jgi:hypothetical protein
MGTKIFITIYIPNSFIVNIPTAAPLAISYLVSFPVDALHIFYFFRVFLRQFLVDSLRQYFFQHPISAITIDLSVSGIGFHKNVPVKMEQKRCSWQTTSGEPR